MDDAISVNCRKCGGLVPLRDDGHVIKCPYCGTRLILEFRDFGRFTQILISHVRRKTKAENSAMRANGELALHRVMDRQRKGNEKMNEDKEAPIGLVFGLHGILVAGIAFLAGHWVALLLAGVLLLACAVVVRRQFRDERRVREQSSQFWKRRRAGLLRRQKHLRGKGSLRVFPAGKTP